MRHKFICTFAVGCSYQRPSQTHTHTHTFIESIIALTSTIYKLRLMFSLNGWVSFYLFLPLPPSLHGHCIILFYLLLVANLIESLRSGRLVGWTIIENLFESEKFLGLLWSELKVNSFIRQQVKGLAQTSGCNRILRRLKYIPFRKINLNFKIRIIVR